MAITKTQASLWLAILAPIVFLLYYLNNIVIYPQNEAIWYSSHPGYSRETTGKSRKHPRTYTHIMLGIQTLNYIGYTEFTASVIKKYHSIDSGNIYLANKEAFDYNKSWLVDWYGQHTKIITRKSIRHATRVLLKIFKQSTYKVLFLTDSNVVFSSDWGEFITQHMIKGNVPFLSLYHSADMHNISVDCQIYKDELCEGAFAAEQGVAISKAMADIILSKYSLLLEKWDWNGILYREKVPALYPRKSIVFNIGRTEQGDNFCGTNDAPYGFRLCEFPEWIRNGIEFYFDRCTNPQELFSPQISLKYANIEKRMWVRPAIAYSLYGNSTRYTNGALANSKRVFSIYPGWKIWVYLDDTVDPNITDELCANNVKIINMTGSVFTNGRSWRYLVASEPVSMFAMRDIDARLLERGKIAVDEWIQSGRKFHVMRDHVYHAKYAINAGLWGGKGGAIPNMSDLMIQHKIGSYYLADTDFLKNVIWKIVKESVWVHDSHSLHIFGEDHPFASPWKSTEYVGGIDYF